MKILRTCCSLDLYDPLRCSTVCSPLELQMLHSHQVLAPGTFDPERHANNCGRY